MLAIYLILDGSGRSDVKGAFHYMISEIRALCGPGRSGDVITI